MNALVNYPPQVMADGSARVSPGQLRIHRVTEAISFVVGAPLMLWIATRKRELVPVEKYLLGGFAAGALTVDTYLWWRFHQAAAAQASAALGPANSNTPSPPLAFPIRPLAA